NQEGELLVNLKTNYPDLVIDIGKIGEISKKKTSGNGKKQIKKLCTAVCALLNSGGGIVRMESEDKKYSLETHGIGDNIERSLRELMKPASISEYLTWMQQQNHLLVFVKTWSCGDPEQKSGTTLGRICSPSTGLYFRCKTSVLSMCSGRAAEFLRKKRCNKDSDENRASAKKIRLDFDGGASYTTRNIEEDNIQDTVVKFLQKDKLMVGEGLNFPETTHIEFKNFATENIMKYMKETLPKYVSAFANTQGGYLIFGVDDDSTVVGCCHEVGKEALEKTVADAIGSMLIHHFCGSQAGVQFETHILSVYEKTESLETESLKGYVCAVRVKPFCCVAFGGKPESWMVTGDKIERLSLMKWIEMMTDADPDLSVLPDKFENELSLANGPPLIRPVYSKAGLPCVSELQESLYPVGSNEIKWKPEAICTELFSDYPGLQDLMKTKICSLKKGILIFSRSWAVEIGSQKTQDIVCDALLVAEKEYPVLYTVVKEVSSAAFKYSRDTARALKQKLVNDGGCAIQLCVLHQVLHLSDTQHQMEVEDDDVPQQDNQPELRDRSSLYPQSYILTSRGVSAFLRALVIVVLCFKSYLSDHLGCEIFNLLTLKQYELLSKNLHKTRELFVFGLPGTGKTIVALKNIERIRNIFRCSPREILYICENTPLMKFVRNENCQSVTRTTFVSKTFPEVKYIMVDEAQNFRLEEDWYQYAKQLVKQKKGILWVFLDFFQSTHPYRCGLNISELYPQEWLTKVVRNARQIYNVVFEQMRKILQERKNEAVIPYEVLERLFNEAQCAHSLPGSYVMKEDMETDEMLDYVIWQCHSYTQQGYPMKDIAILCSTYEAAESFKEMLKYKLHTPDANKKCKVRLVLGQADNVLDDVIVIDSIRRFSGLERKLVFGIHPVPAQEEIASNLLLCLASRANTKLHVLYHKDN
ncbi:SLN13 protein, partial [Tricholaema leucomelas]|nr:SLN13 protein [Tricholaema leucomelas]